MNQTTFANHWLYLRFLCLAYFHLFNGCDAKTGAEPQNGSEPKWHCVKQRQRISARSYSGLRNTGPIETGVAGTYNANCSSSAFASFRSSVSNPSVNQP